ncbi:PspC domain-containing protein [Flavobacterium sp. Sd200]|uniref:PspC domain-containing protein n=1 Tax=Flavobacterium sp. Sd200 TaxID=2692211 RepID=UPI00136A06F6|nr:PspC domain-containing protein [Flavobacterium sp. Sd200]MXN92369.1 PspC domain-containing protein [Flavobacterium sp. Sd200]
MNKTVSINLGGFFFHIDEDAYQKLNRYFDAIRQSLTPDGRDEIMGDIESRIAELLSEKLKNEKQVVSLREVEDIIAVMGQPEDYRIDDEKNAENTGAKSSSNFNYNYNYGYTKTRKFFRDTDNGMVGGVCAGLGHYFGIDPLWIRIIAILSLFLSFGTSLLIYLLLMVLIPKAITTSEKLEMTGEPINISNIEKKVKEEFSNLSDKINSVDYDKLGNNVKNGAEKVGTGISKLVLGIFKVFAKIIGAIITVFSALILGGLLITLILMLFSSTMVSPSWYPYVLSYNYTNVPMSILCLIGFFSIGIPLFVLFLLGLKILVDNLKPIGNLTRLTLLALWLISLAAAIYLILLQSSQFGVEGKMVNKQEINLKEGDVLEIKFKNNEFFSKSLRRDYSDFKIQQDSFGNGVMYSNRIHFQVLKTDEAKPYVQIEKVAEGASISDARKSAENIKYNFKIEGNTLTLDNYLIMGIVGANAKYHAQRVEIFLYLPEETLFKPDGSLKDYDDTDNEFFDLWFDGEDYIYKMGNTKVDCLNCIEMAEAMDIPEPPEPNMSDAEIEAMDRELEAQEKEIEAKSREFELKMKRKAKKDQEKILQKLDEATKE